MLHGRHDRKIEEDGRERDRVDPMRLPRIQQSNNEKLFTGRPGERRRP
jgi:hypothetical protein